MSHVEPVSIQAVQGRSWGPVCARRGDSCMQNQGIVIPGRATQGGRVALKHPFTGLVIHTLSLTSVELTIERSYCR